MQKGPPGQRVHVGRDGDEEQDEPEELADPRSPGLLQTARGKKGEDLGRDGHRGREAEAPGERTQATARVAQRAEEQDERHCPQQPAAAGSVVRHRRKRGLKPARLGASWR